MIRKVAVLAVGLLAALAVSAIAREIPALPEVSDELAAANSGLAQERARLARERAALRSRRDAHNQACRSVEEGSAADASCIKSHAELDAAINSHIEASKQYLNNHAVAIKPAANQKSAPHTDTSVVDARNVPSGLPKGVENAINGAYANAPPGVIERVRKGFQAVMARDWPVAKAWFQDALDRDPTNIGLKRMVALVDYSQRPNQTRAPVAAHNQPAGPGGGSKVKEATAQPRQTNPAPATTSGTNAQVPVESDLELLFPGLRAMRDRVAPRFRTLPDGSTVQLPRESDVEFLFFPRAQPPVSKTKSVK